MAVVLEAITHVCFAGRTIEPGTVFSVDDVFAKRLIQGDSAKVHNAIERANMDENQTELKKAFMALKLDELKELAEKNNVELSPEDTTKAPITKKLMDAGVVLDDQTNI